MRSSSKGRSVSITFKLMRIRAKGQTMIAWMGLALDASPRMFLGGVVSVHRDRDLADRLLRQVRACCQGVQAILIRTDGWNAYPKSMMRAIRSKVKKTAGRGRTCLEVWPEWCLATVIKQTKKKQVVEITRKITLGPLEKAKALLQMTKGCQEFNTSLLERESGTMRERLAALTRQCRHAAHRPQTLEGGMYLIGGTYNCSVIRSLLLHGSNPSEQDGVAQVPSLTYPFRNDREDDHANILCLIRLCPNAHEVVLVRSPEHVHRLVILLANSKIKLVLS